MTKKDGRTETVDGFAEKIKNRNSGVTKQQFKEAVSEVIDKELSVDDLDEVAGGFALPLVPGNN